MSRGRFDVPIFSRRTIARVCRFEDISVVAVKPELHSDVDLEQSAFMFYAGIFALALTCAALISIVWSTLRLGISPMPTSGAVLREMIELISPDLQGEVHELGAGWGTLAWAVASHCPKAQIVAWEASFFPYLFCRLRQWAQPRPNLVLHWADFYVAPLTEARLVIAYLWTGGMARLSEKFESELPPGAEVISHTFAWRGRTPTVVRTARDLYRTRIYLYLNE